MSSPQKPDLELPDAFSFDLPEDAKDAICLLLTTSAMLEIALGRWLTRLAGMDDDIGQILIGRMDNRAKIEKITELFRHHNNPAAVRSLKWLAKHSETHGKIRNIVVHNVCFGASPDGKTLYFLTFKNFRGDRENQVVPTLTIKDIRNAARFAHTATGKIQAAWQPLPHAKSA